MNLPSWSSFTTSDQKSPIRLVLNYNKCKHGVTELIDASSSNDKDIICKLYAINHGSIPKPYPEINHNLQNPFKDATFTKWEDTVQTALFCKNCWLDLLPYLHELLKNINQSSNWKCINEKSLIHLLFFNEMIHFPFAIRYVSKDESMFQLASAYYFKILQRMYRSQMFFDIGLQNCALTATFYLISEHLAFAKTCIFWKKKHTIYSLKAKTDLKNLMIQMVCNLMMQEKDIYMKKRIIGSVNILSSMIAFEYVSKTKLLVTEFEREAFVRNIFHCIFPESYKQHINNGDIDDTILRFCKMVNQNSESHFLKELLYLLYYENKMDRKNEKCRKLVLKYRLYYKLMKQCFNPKCNVMKYNENAVALGNYCLYPKQTKLLKRKKYYKCKGCFIAVYCSVKCQKIHWNRYNHGMQCYLSLS